MGSYSFSGRTAILIPGEDYDSLSPDYDTDEILYLDVSVEFNPASPNWKSITGIAPPLAFHSMSIGGESNELLIIFGGTSKYTIPSNPLYIFNTTSSTTATNSPTTVNVKGSIEHTSTTRYNDSMVFIFGGTSQVITNDNTTDIVTDAFNDMHVLDSKSITFNTISPSNGVFPFGVFHHSSTLLSDNKIYIIGGVDKNNAFMPMGSINIFDTTTNQWSNQSATGTIPTDRRVHRAVGTNDNKIIIYGGCNKDYSISYSDLRVLDTTTLQWTAPATQGTPPPPMYAHTMTMVGTNVIIAFGYISGFNTAQDIYILDSTKYTWMPTYVPNNLEITNTKPINASSNVPSSSPSSPSSDQIGVIVGSIIGSLAAIFLIIVLVICMRKKRKNGSFFTKPYEQNQPSVPPISGTLPYNQLPTTVNNQDPARQLPPTMSHFVSKSNAGSDKGSTATNNEHNESYYNNSSSRNSSKTNSNRFSVIPYLDNPYGVEKDTTDPTPIVNPTSSSSLSSSPSNKNLFNEHDDDYGNTKATSGINDLYGYSSQLNYSNNNSDYYSEKPQPPTPPSKYDDDDGYPQSNRLSASSSIYAPSRPDSPPSMNPPILPSYTDTSSFSSSNENNDEIMRVTDNDYDNDNAVPIFSISPDEEAGVNEPRKVEKRAFSLRSAQRLSSTVVRPNKGTPSTTEETITEEFTEENL
nr:3233_t:CDS:2 [Entrophospora candida]